MKHTWLCVITPLLCLVLISIHGIAAPNSVPAPRRIELASRQMGDGSVLRIVCDDDVNPQAMAALLGKAKANKVAKILHYHAELVPKGSGDPITIWDTLDPVPKDAPDPNPSPCADLACGDSQFITVFEGGGQLWLYYQDYQYVGAPVGTINLIAGDWSLYAASGPIDPREIKVSINMNSDGDWEVRVIHRNGQDGRTTLYRKPKDKWEFNVISSNRDPAK